MIEVDNSKILSFFWGIIITLNYSIQDGHAINYIILKRKGSKLSLFGY